MKNTKKSAVDTWSNMIKKTTGVLDESKIEWMSQVAHNQVLNEADGWDGNGTNIMGGAWQNAAGALGGAYQPYNTLYNTVGVGNVVPAGRPAMTGAEFADNAQLGSGDKFPSLLPIALKVAAKTIGFELVNTTPLAGPAGVLPYMDYVYSGSKQPFGATPARNIDTENPSSFQNYNKTFDQTGSTAYGRVSSLYGLPYAFKASVKGVSAEGGSKDDDKSASQVIADLKTKADLKAGTQLAIKRDGNAVIYCEFIGWSRIDGDPMFKILEGFASLADAFAEGSAQVSNKLTDGQDETVSFSIESPRLVSMLEDSIQGFAGAGPEDNDPWYGTYQNGTVLYEPMTRGTGELQYARQISLQFFTKNVAVGTVAVSSAVTQEQVTDLQKQWGIDVLKMVENACVNELSQTINRHITSRLFALGWKNHAKLQEIEGVNLNLSFDPAKTGNTPAYAIPQGAANEQGEYVHQSNVALPWKGISMPDNASFENRDTLLKRLTVNFLSASNWILQRGRYGAATFAVTNVTVATALQSNAQYAFSPIANSISQEGGSLYPCGTMFGMTIYVDPLMAGNDCRVLVGRKGGKDEPGTHFCPYVMADKVQFIAEGTAAPKLVIKSRYSLVDAGFYPETQYLTFDVDFNGIL